jgi:hypothetical protein
MDYEDVNWVEVIQIEDSRTAVRTRNYGPFP